MNSPHGTLPFVLKPFVAGRASDSICHGALLVGAIAAIVAIYVVILRVNSGTFVFTIDDPYIHLALAERIRLGFYGINLGEIASPSSSIIYPFLLVPFTFSLISPIFYCGIGLCVSVSVCFTLLRAAGLPPAMAAATTVLTTLSLNWLGLVFTGLEHSLHVAASLVVVLGLFRFAQDGRVRWWFVAALVAGPALRYEGLGISAAALFVLASSGRRAVAMQVGTIIVAIVSGFSVFLWANGLSPVPSSILVKQAALRSTFDLSSLSNTVQVPREIVRTIGRNLTHTSGTVLALLASGALCRLLYPQNDRIIRPLSLFVVLSASAHLIAGSYGWFMRYEIYALSVTVLATILVNRHVLRLGQASFRWRSTAVITVALLTLGAPYVQGFGGVVQPVFIVRGSGDIYRQQFQMRRLAVDFLRLPVAANDIGLISVGNREYVLDLWGLASDDARRLRLASNRPTDWMNNLARAHDVRVAMIYDAWFGADIPRSWIRIGELITGDIPYSVSDIRVAIYATRHDGLSQIRTVIREWAAALPAGAQFREDVPVDLTVR